MSALSPLWIPAVAAYLGVAWLAVFHRFWGRRRHGLAAVDYWSSCGGFVALALMITLPLPPVMAEIDALTGLIGLADTLAAVAALLAILAWLVYLGRLVPPRERRLFARRGDRWIPWPAVLALLTLAVALLAGRFVWAPGELGFRLGPAPSAGRYYLAAAHVAYRAACAAELGLVILVLRRLAAVVGPRPALQARLRAIRWVLAYMLLYIGYEALSAVAWQLPDLSSRVFRLRSLLLLAAIVAPDRWYLAGLALGRRAAAPVMGLAVAWREWRAYRRLYPLWAALYPVAPALSQLAPPSRRGAWWPGPTPTIGLCRLVAEIHDWAIALWPYRATRAVAAAEALGRRADLPAPERLALIEAVALAGALANWSAARMEPTAASGPWPGRAPPGGATLSEEVAALVPVAELFARSPLVAAALAAPDEG